MNREGINKALGVIGCAACWIITAFLAGLEAICIHLWISGTLYVMNWGAEENPYAAEDAWAAGVFSSIIVIPLTLMLMLAVYSTIKLRKRGKPREHITPDKR